MNWIRLSADYFRHRKTLRLVRKLGEVAALYPLRLWLWAVEQSEDGSLRDLDAEELAIIVGHAGDAKELWRAMDSCGFIERAESDGWQIRSWDEHQAPMIESREKAKARWRRWRDRKLAGDSAPTANAAPTPAQREANAATDVQDGHTNKTDVRRERSRATQSEATTLPDLSDYLESLRRLHPKFANEFAVANALAEVSRLLPPLPEFEATLAAWAATEDWTKEGGRYAPSPARWLRDGGFRSLPPTPKRAPKPARTVDDERSSVVRPALLAAHRAGRLTDTQHDDLLDRVNAARSLAELAGIAKEIPNAAA